MTIVSQASQRSATRAASPVPDALKTTVASVGNRNCTLPGLARCQATFVIVMGFQIPSQPLSMGSLQLGQREARSVSGGTPEVSHGLVPVSPALRWGDRLGKVSTFFFW